MTKTLVLFDVDGTLTVPRQKAEQSMYEFLRELRQKVTVGIVGGSDLTKIKEQLGENVLELADFTFSENGLMAHKGTELLAVQSLKDHLGEPTLKKLINFVLRYVADLDIPIKRGTFIEFRSGMLNISPIGRNCSQRERTDFEAYDATANVRRDMIAALHKEFPDIGLTYAVGGQISFDAFPPGWDKTYCLRFVERDFGDIHFFGDKTYKGGNDHEIFESERTIGHTVTGPGDTMRQCRELFLS